MVGAPICKGCRQAIHSAYVTAVGATWHLEHFVCAACGRAWLPAYRLHSETSRANAHEWSHGRDPGWMPA
ncbi:LIM domain-containing protein [Candidatus Roseilinea sp. NK_OTU-006]|uniref:LIM domain-containing protein n=1 Tax=Candidatus Roseilinea sp. NK_OTU-006 TaxID=2704250 RepID=UPI00145D8DE5